MGVNGFLEVMYSRWRESESKTMRFRPYILEPPADLPGLTEQIVSLLGFRATLRICMRSGCPAACVYVCMGGGRRLG